MVARARQDKNWVMILFLRVKRAPQILSVTVGLLALPVMY